MDKTIKNAIMDDLKMIIDRENYGMYAKYEASPRNIKILFDNKIKIDWNNRTVNQNGKAILKIRCNYSSRKVNGMYKMLKPELIEIIE